MVRDTTFRNTILVYLLLDRHKRTGRWRTRSVGRRFGFENSELQDALKSRQPRMTATARAHSPQSDFVASLRRSIKMTHSHLAP